MPRKPYWLHETRDDYAWMVKGRTEVISHVNRPKPPRMKPLLHQGGKP